VLQKVTRRGAITVGAASTGTFLTSHARISHAGPLKDVWGEDFMMQWSPPENVKRDLTPGKSHIRLSCEAYRLRLPKEGESWVVLSNPSVMQGILPARPEAMAGKV